LEKLMKRFRRVTRLACLPLLLAAIFTATPANHARAAVQPPVINITAKRFGFSPNIITLKRGETVKLRLTSEDLTHGFLVNSLNLDEVVTPGQPTEVMQTPQQTGRFTTICSHFCGAGHGNMNMTIVVE
jgi:cytochrome c oxidase subunit II